MNNHTPPQKPFQPITGQHWIALLYLLILGIVIIGLSSSLVFMVVMAIRVAISIT